MKTGIIILVLVALMVCLAGLLVGRCVLIGKRVFREKPVSEYCRQVREKESFYALEHISKNIITVIVALEDEQFWKHRGIDIKKLVHAVLVNLKNRRSVEGGSTITQQLAKNMYFTFNKNINRKLAEMYVALKLERILTKEQILELYLNIIYFGNGKYGIKEACELYIEKKPDDISVDQAITLGCILPAPGKYNPLNKNGLFTKARQNAEQKLYKKGITY